VIGLKLLKKVKYTIIFKMFKSLSYYMASYLSYDTKYFFLSADDKLLIDDYHDKIAKQHEIVDHISLIITGHLIFSNMTHLIQDNEVIKLANNAICTLLLVNDLLIQNNDYLAELFAWLGQREHYETYTTPGYNYNVLNNDHINYNLIKALANMPDLDFDILPKKPNLHKHLFTPFPTWYTSYEVVLLGRLTPEQISNEINLLASSTRTKYKNDVLYTQQINYVSNCVVNACNYIGIPSAM